MYVPGRATNCGTAVPHHTGCPPPYATVPRYRPTACATVTVTVIVTVIVPPLAMSGEQRERIGPHADSPPPMGIILSNLI